jgi:hypothetical protein
MGLERILFLLLGLILELIQGQTAVDLLAFSVSIEDEQEGLVFGKDNSSNWGFKSPEHD